MKIHNRAEFNCAGKLDWIPVLSTFVSLGKIIQKLFTRIFSSKANENAQAKTTPKELKGRVRLWSSDKRTKIALVPFFGNFIIIRHDCRANRAIKKLEKELHSAPECCVEDVYNKFPDDVKNSTSSMLHLVEVNPEVLKYSEYRNDAKFMQKVARRNPENLKYATELMKDEKFVLETADEIYRNAKIIHQWQKKPKTKEYTRPGYLNILDYAPDLCQKEDFMLKLKSRTYLHPLQHAVPHFANNQEFILKMMDKYREYYDWHRDYEINQTKPLYVIASEALKGDLEFIKKAMDIDAESWKYATPALQDVMFADPKILNLYSSNPGFMTEAIRRNPKNIEYVNCSHRNHVHFVVPLEKVFSSVELRNDIEFIKKALLVDQKVWQYAGETARFILLTNKDFLREHCSNYQLMCDAILRDPKNVQFVSASLAENVEFQYFISHKCPRSVWTKLYGTAEVA